MSLQRKVNLFHYNIWRFERWTRYLLFGDRRLASIEIKDSNELEDLVPFAVGPVDELMLPNYSGKHFAVLLFLGLLSILNVVSSLFGFDFSSIWFWGAIACGIVSFMASHYLTPIPLKTSDRNVLLDEFETFESMSDSRKRISGLVTFLTVIAIWTVSVLSFVHYLQSSIAAQP